MSEWISVKDRLPELPEDKSTSEDVLAGFWCSNTWLREDLQKQFSWGVCRIVRVLPCRDFPDGKRWHTYGPAHSQITHWMPPPKPPVAEGE